MSIKNPPPRRPVVLIILDGYGVNPARINNAVQETKTPVFDQYFSSYSHCVLEASGQAVGLPDGQMGNSEVGHTTLGCGCIVKQDLVRIDDAITDGSFYKNSTFLAAIQKSKDNHRPLHLFGLVSDGGVHSHISHLLALIKLCRKQGVMPLVHMFSDGRDTAPRVAKRYVDIVTAKLNKANGAIVSLCGRYYGMDRDNRWERTKIAWDLLANGNGVHANSANEAIDKAYEEGIGDEFIPPTVLPGYQKIKETDGVISFNFRNDRPRQMVAAIGCKSFEWFERPGEYKKIVITCMTEYDPIFLAPIAFSPERPPVMLGKVVSLAGLKQTHCAETEKYAHVTYFFNGGKEQPFAGEDRILVPSPDVATYDLKPEMSAPEVADKVIEAIDSEDYAFIVVNFANGDMVGHTAVKEAIIKAVEALDQEVGRLLDHAVKKEWSVIMTADHGNCDEFIDPVTGEPHTQHTTYPVPCLVIDQDQWRLNNGQGLSAIAPTVLQLMGINQPHEMTGKSLLLDKIKLD
jgi:2,3-bisphosphoglycerate-independent phosphoglycerate mutase